MGVETRTVAVAGFPYKGTLADGRVVHKFATRGQEIELSDLTDVERGDRLGYFQKEGEATPDAPPALSLDDLGLMTDDQLLDLWGDKPPAAKELLAAVGLDKELAQRVLTVEQATPAPRKTVVGPLEKVIEATPDATEGSEA